MLGLASMRTSLSSSAYQPTSSPRWISRKLHPAPAGTQEGQAPLSGASQTDEEGTEGARPELAAEREQGPGHSGAAAHLRGRKRTKTLMFSLPATWSWDPVRGTSSNADWPREDVTEPSSLNSCAYPCLVGLLLLDGVATLPREPDAAPAGGLGDAGTGPERLARRGAMACWGEALPRDVTGLADLGGPGPATAPDEWLYSDLSDLAGLGCLLRSWLCTKGLSACFVAALPGLRKGAGLTDRGGVLLGPAQRRTGVTLERASAHPAVGAAI